MLTSHSRPNGMSAMNQTDKSLKRFTIAVTALVALCGWTLRAYAQTSEIKTEDLMTYLAPISKQRIPIDASTAIATGLPGGWVRGSGSAGNSW
jgi:hypothetical protein